MLAPDSMLQQIKPTTEMSDYHVILPSGLYTSGTYTIPGGYTWDDFQMIIVSGFPYGAAEGYRLGVGMAGVIGDAGWDRPIDVGHRDTEYAAVTYVSANELTIQRNVGQIAMVYGYLK